MRTGRPKGSKQKRDETKYRLPPGVSLLENQTNEYNQETKLKFNDETYGQFTSYFKALLDANASTHPEAIKARRNKTNLERYGTTCPMSNKEIQLKSKNTLMERYGVEHTLQHAPFLKKSQNTLMKNYGVSSPLKNSNILTKARTRLNESGKVYISKEQQEIQEYIESLGFKCKQSFLGGEEPYEIDIRIENTNLAIEYNGLYWHTAERKGIRYHFNKTKVANSKGLNLIHIFGHQWKEKPEVIKAILKSKLGLNEKIPARKCKTRIINHLETKDFLNKYHLLGHGRTTFTAVGLFYEGELISVAALSRHHRGGSEILLNRYCVKPGITVVGGLSKLTKYLTEEYNLISTFIDLSYATPDSWLKTGWLEVSRSNPDYFYYNTNTGKILSKQSLKKGKSNNFHNGLTESEYAKSVGLSRVYDCGKVKLTYIKHQIKGKKI